MIELADLSETALELLPRRLRDFVRLIGLPATLAIVERYGGTRLYVPATWGPEHPLVALIGEANLARLSAEFGGDEHADVPRGIRALRHLRDERIRAEYQTTSAAALARRYGLAERHIWRIVAQGGGAADSAQDGLFGGGL